ncbi:glycosyltransferase family 2 protein [Halomicroarcula sp. F28]|uniref:glycosyltransferase family 2 protein n=1 Tax=Haloarcula salinisoli TaxID=2487746 RepID=UPI001C729FA3|nr:glycosyltransferase family 2 protein [Halomicroarcula salinisoli]MBX0288349.1 glycosyltransferase family 2 protein [Halomicroarcula salinisoli]
MYEGKTVGVVIPAYNEEEFIEAVIRGVPEYVDRIYAVDDASTDATWTEILAAPTAEDGPGPRYEQTDGGTDRGTTGKGLTPTRSSDRTDPDQPGGTADLQESWSVESMADTETPVHRALAERTQELRRQGRVVAIQHRSNQGAGGAIKTGYLAALVDGVDAVATIDGDGQMDPGVLSDLLDPIVDDDIDYTKGNRLLHREYRSEMPTLRLVGNFILTFLTKIASGYWRVMDPQNGYTVISRQALEAVSVREMYEDYGYCNELLIKLNVADTRIADVPTDVEYSDEESHIQYSSYIPRVSMLLLRGFLWRLKTKYLILDFHPLVFFYFLGAASSGVGVLSGLYTVWQSLATGSSYLLDEIVSPVLLVTGLTFLLVAMVLDRAENDALVRPQQLGANSARME